MQAVFGGGRLVSRLASLGAFCAGAFDFDRDAGGTEADLPKLLGEFLGGVCGDLEFRDDSAGVADEVLSAVFALADSGAGEVPVGGVDVVDESRFEEHGEVSVDTDDVDSSAVIEDGLVDGVCGEGFWGFGEDVDDLEAGPGEPQASFPEGYLG